MRAIGFLGRTEVEVSAGMSRTPAGRALANGQRGASDAGDCTVGDSSREIDPEEGVLDVESCPASLPPVVGRSCQNRSHSFSHALLVPA